jgi:TonB family protein
MAFNWINAAIEYARTDQNARYEALQSRISMSLSTESARAAARLVSPDGPVSVARLGPGGTDYVRSVKYPRGMQHLGREGMVRLIMLVGADGVAGDIVIDTPSGYPQLDAVVLKSVPHVPFIPGEVDGHPVASWQVMTWNFLLE